MCVCFPPGVRAEQACRSSGGERRQVYLQLQRSGMTSWQGSIWGNKEARILGGEAAEAETEAHLLFPFCLVYTFFLPGTFCSSELTLLYSET